MLESSKKAIKLAFRLSNDGAKDLHEFSGLLKQHFSFGF